MAKKARLFFSECPSFQPQFSIFLPVLLPWFHTWCNYHTRQKWKLGERQVAQLNKSDYIKQYLITRTNCQCCQALFLRWRDSTLAMSIILPRSGVYSSLDFAFAINGVIFFLKVSPFKIIRICSYFFLNSSCNFKPEISLSLFSLAGRSCTKLTCSDMAEIIFVYNVSANGEICWSYRKFTEIKAKCFMSFGSSSNSNLTGPPSTTTVYVLFFNFIDLLS